MENFLIFTIGYGNLARERLLEIWREQGVKVVVDVRSSPYSRHRPELNKDNLQNWLTENGLGYVFLGDKLGGRPHDQALYNEKGEVDYQQVVKAEAFLRGMQSLVEWVGESGPVCLLCAEGDPRNCHRSHLIGECLFARNIICGHLLHSGELIDHAKLRMEWEDSQGELFG